MTTYRRFIETNDNEGETWNFWLQVDGNTTGLAILGDVLDKVNAGWTDRPFVLANLQLEGYEVDVLVRHGDSGYMHQHNKVDGLLQLPADFTSADEETVSDYLYKGGIRVFFKESAE